MQFCPEIVTWTLNGVVLIWRKALVGETITPDKCCKNLIRTCLYNPNKGPYWSGGLMNNTDLNETCEKCDKITEDIIDIGKLPLAKRIDELNRTITKSKSQLHTPELYSISKILSNVASKSSNLSKSTVNEFVEVVDKLMDLDENILRDSQDKLNTTDNILYAIDKLLVGSTSDVHSIHITSRKTHQSSGILGWSLFQNMSLEPLMENNSTLHEISKTNAVVSVLFSFIHNEDEVCDTVLSIFNNIKLFIDKPSISKDVFKFIPNILRDCSSNNNDDVNVTIVVKINHRPKHNVGCMHWQYGLNTTRAIKGFWKNNSVANMNYFPYLICNYNHMTHFGMLIGDVEDDPALSLVSALGGTMTFVGAVILFVMMYMERTKLTKANIMFINFLIVIVVMPILMFAAEILNNPDTQLLCQISGVLLHYFLLLQFVFSSFIAYFHYLRFVVIVRKVEDIAINCTIIAWFIPIIPVLIFASISLDNYKNKNLCFLSGLNKKLGVVLPISLSLTINIILFFLIFKSLQKSVSSDNQSQRKKYIYKWGYSYVLISGVSWIFGLLTLLNAGILYSYVFTTLGSIQGFLLSLSFIKNESQKSKGKYVVSDTVAYSQVSTKKPK